MKRKKFTHFTKITAMDLYHVVKKQKCRCALTGQKLKANTISVDHIVALSNGGKNEIDNIRLVHVDINRMKLAYDDATFLENCRLVVNHKST